MTTPRYRLADVTPKGLFGSACDINSSGAVLATVWGTDEIRFGAVWHRGTVVEVRWEKGQNLDACAMNDAGMIIGAAQFADEDQPCRWRDGQLELLGIAEDDSDSCAVDVNKHGVIVGYHTRDGYQRPVLWFGDPRRYYEFYPDFVPFDIGGSAYATGINDCGLITGRVFCSEDAFIKNQDSYERIASGAGEASVNPRALNNKGTVVGWQRFVDGSFSEPVDDYPFRYESRLQRLPTISGSQAQAWDINDAGITVGYSSYGCGHDEFHGAVWHQSKVYDLNELVTNIGKYTITHAPAINNAGQIAADGVLHGEDRVLLLTPIA